MTQAHICKFTVHINKIVSRHMNFMALSKDSGGGKICSILENAQSVPQCLWQPILFTHLYPDQSVHPQQAQPLTSTGVFQITPKEGVSEHFP